MLGLVLSLALAATDAQAGRLPAMPRSVFSVAWQRNLGAAALGENHFSERGGPVYDQPSRLILVGTHDGWLHAFRIDGSLAWEFRAEGAFSAEVLVDADIVYAGCDDGRLYAIELGSGKERWRYESHEQLATRPALADGLVYVASLQDTVFAVDARTGAWKWHHRREPREGFVIHGAAAVAVGGGLVHAGFSDGTVAGLDAATGVARWERQVAPSGTYPDIDSLALAGERLYAAAYSGAVVALEAATGKPLWQHALPEASRLALLPGALVAVSTGKVEALSPLDGRAAWTVPLHGSPAATPRLAGRWLLVSADAGGLRFLEFASGRTARVLDPGSGVSAAPGLGAGRAYVLSNAGRLLALDVH
jgi:outer membrane protein assembly factor BamB